MGICKTCGKSISAYCPDCRLRKTESKERGFMEYGTPDSFMKKMGIMGW